MLLLCSRYCKLPVMNSFIQCRVYIAILVFLTLDLFSGLVIHVLINVTHLGKVRGQAPANHDQLFDRIFRQFMFSLFCSRECYYI